MGERELTADEILLLVRARGFRPTRLQVRKGTFAGMVLVELLAPRTFTRLPDFGASGADVPARDAPCEPRSAPSNDPLKWMLHRLLARGSRHDPRRAADAAKAETHSAIRGYAWPDEWCVYGDHGYQYPDHPDQPRVVQSEEDARPALASVAGILAAPQPPPPGDDTARLEYEAALRLWGGR